MSRSRKDKLTSRKCKEMFFKNPALNAIADIFTLFTDTCMLSTEKTYSSLKDAHKKLKVSDFPLNPMEVASQYLLFHAVFFYFNTRSKC